MMANTLRRADIKIVKLALVLAAAACLLPPAAQAADTLDVVLDQATIMKLPDKVSTIVVGNPLIADVAVQSGGLVIVTGKGFGATNLIALDRAGAVLMERSIVVRGADANTIAVFRGVERETYSCTPNCERRITLGDSAGYFTATAAQADARSGQASMAGTKGPTR